MSSTLRQQRSLFLGAMTGIFISAWFIHSLYLINWDVSWDMRITQRWLAGGTYIKSFVDANPPLMLFLYTPPVLFAKFTTINMVTALRLYVFTLAALSLVLSYHYTQQLFFKNKRLLGDLFLLLIAFALLILPIQELGEREHLMLIFTLPYFLAVSTRLQGNRVTPAWGITTGLFAVLGFALKPYFMMAFVLTELYYLFQTRKTFGWVRSEAMTVILFFLFFLVSIFVFYPEYIKTVVPLSMMFYYSGFRNTWLEILTVPEVFYCFFAGIFYYIGKDRSAYKNLCGVLIIATAGFLFSYFIQLTTWRYHFLPAFITASLVYFLLLGEFAINMRKDVINAFFMFTLTVLVLYIPLLYLVIISEEAGKYTSHSAKLIQYIQTKAPHKSVYLLSASPNEFFPAVDYTDAKYDSRFQHLFWIPGALKQSLLAKEGKLPAEKIAGENTFIHLVIDDIATIKPDFIFVDAKDYKPFFKHLSFDYLSYFSQQQKFHELWKNYRYVTTIEEKDFDTRDLYRWKLYLLPSIAALDPEKLSGSVIILTGTGATRTAYYLHDHQLIRDQFTTAFTRKILLTAQEQAFMNASPDTGIIPNDPHNNAFIDHIINSALIVYFYRYEIYQRIV
jgi:hypothetical protein